MKIAFLPNSQMGKICCDNARIAEKLVAIQNIDLKYQNAEKLYWKEILHIIFICRFQFPNQRTPARVEREIIITAKSRQTF